MVKKAETKSGGFIISSRVIKNGTPKILLGAAYSAIEPLGIMHLGGLARDVGVGAEYVLIKHRDGKPDYEELFKRVEEVKPDFVGFNIYTGSHLQLFAAYDELKQRFPDIGRIIGGPHATYFPEDAAQHAEWVVQSEGFFGLKGILNKELAPGIVPQFDEIHRFPLPDREGFYEFSPVHRESAIKSEITETGCPFKCTYCYNSSTRKPVDDESLLVAAADGTPMFTRGEGGLSLVQTSFTQGCAPDRRQRRIGGRLFPSNQRDLDDIIREGQDILRLAPNTKLVYIQDDVHGFRNDWLAEFAERWSKEVGLPYHAQMRWEMLRGDEGERKLDLVKQAGATGLTLAIEAANPTVRVEVLDRKMDQEDMFEGMKKAVDRGLRIRTEQITGLPYGATSQQTPMNLEADIGLVELNVELRRQSGGPLMAWASTLAPYNGTRITDYAVQYGHFTPRKDNDVPDTFFEGSVLRFPKEWVGPELEHMKDDPGVWLQNGELERYVEQNRELRNWFNVITQIPEGHKLARKYLDRPESEYGVQTLGLDIQEHVQALGAVGSRVTSEMDQLTATIKDYDVDPTTRAALTELVPVVAVLPSPIPVMDRIAAYSRYGTRFDGTPQPIEIGMLSTAIRRAMYEGDLYETDQPMPVPTRDGSQEHPWRATHIDQVPSLIGAESHLAGTTNQGKY